MADSKTTDYELIKEDAALPVRIAPINSNFDIIDAALKANAEAASAAKSAADEAKSVADGAIPSSQKGSANGVAELDENGIVPKAQLPTANQFELIESIEITDSDALSVISRNQTPEGKPYDLNKMLVAVSIPATATAHNPYISAIDAVMNMLSFTTNTTTAFLHQFLFEVKSGRAFGERVSSGTEANPVQKYATIRSMGKYEVQSLTRLYFYSGNADINFPTGTKIDIYGVWR